MERKVLRVQRALKKKLREAHPRRWGKIRTESWARQQHLGKRGWGAWVCGCGHARTFPPVFLGNAAVIWAVIRSQGMPRTCGAGGRVRARAHAHLLQGRGSEPQSGQNCSQESKKGHSPRASLAFLGAKETRTDTGTRTRTERPLFLETRGIRRGPLARAIPLTADF